MTDRPLNDASRAQHVAADPARSTWLTANAGSGKTRVLTDRVARLLLNGTSPERILCLTYTKAAATEMQNRLLDRLGGWAMLDDIDLRAQLATLGVTDLPDLARARRLFAQAIETPGGLKVQTIHSFCAAVLRRFPLEAGVPQGFAELDDRTGTNMREEILQDMARVNDPAFADLLTLHSGDEIDGFLASIKGYDTEPDAADLWVQCGLSPDLTEETLLAQVFTPGTAAVLTDLTPLLLQGGKTDAATGAEFAAVAWAAPSLSALAVLEARLLTKTGPNAGLAKTGKFPTKDTQKAAAHLMADIEDLMARVQDAAPLRAGLAQAIKTLALHRFGHAFCKRYTAAKLQGGWLDFDDLIQRTARLLSNASMAQWVLFRLDGGIDHILVDEAQDTSPGQWQVIEHLTTEFTAGEGARDGDRTLFVVGDPKQSIYSFQGADTAVFDARRASFGTAFESVGNPIQQAELLHSFRSSPAILSVVDAVFQGDAAEGLGVPPRHIAFQDTAPGRVELWPPFPKPEKPDTGDWSNPVDQPAANSEHRLLAEEIAQRIAQMRGQPIHDVRHRTTRPVRAGDVLILVQRRAALFEEIIAALKRQGLPVAGADRLKLAAELAVRDIREVLSFLAMPRDDLSLAAALRSPLFGLDEGQLYDLAQPRRGSLWDALRANGGYPRIVAVLDDLLGQVDFLRPYDLIARILIRHEGRVRLIARLGPEAEDGIDELLSQSLTYERSEAPSLTGFLVWLSDDDIEVKRQPGAAGEGEGVIRVMTVHGAKGLESPIVILPDTAKRGTHQTGRTIASTDGKTVFWRGTKPDRSPAIAALVDDEARRRDEENRRLLYVALTRAESWLIVAAAGDAGEGLESWHAMVSAGMDRAAGLTASSHPAHWGGDIRQLDFGAWPADAATVDHTPTVPVPLPDWMRDHPPPSPVITRPIAATSLGGAKALAPTGAAVELDRQAAMLRGTRLHLLLEELPGRAAEDWPDIANATLSGAEGGLPNAEEFAALLDEVAGVVAATDMVSAPTTTETVLREVPLVVNLPGVGAMTGTIDLLRVTLDGVTVVDYKSNFDVPDDAQRVPDGILRQMAAYRNALRRIYPGRAVTAQILWTRGARFMDLPDDVLDAAWQRAVAARRG
ncbi:MAG: double-strand break repair helicase AddA [Paracoccus denitrificans]|nr:MAG: double-strand break repair helicase AddA [Paracoccus denitrificans]PZO85481.1 MAG: double-strand break repair helicase AddA [Paracoccus denitrificans]